MKFTLSVLLSLSLWVGSLSSCLETVEDGVDYFPDKVQPLHSKFWDIEYFDTYKILTNTHAQTSYLLYQCGSTPPADQLNAGHHAVFEVPLAEVAITATPFVAFFEQLASLDLITHFLDDPSLITTPCLLDRIESGDVVTVSPSTTDPDGDLTSGGALDAGQTTFDLPVFMNPPFGSESPYKNSIFITEYSEKTNAGIFEWVKFYAAFFNLEKLANEVVDAAQDRWDCVADNAALVESDSFDKKPTVLWAYYTEYCNGWDVGVCPNYYCEFAEACSADILSSTDGVFRPECGATYMTTEQLVEFGKDADHWIYSWTDWDTVYPVFEDQLKEMKAVREKQVYDVTFSTGGWFEQRVAEHYNVLRDFCHVVGTQQGLNGRGWFRNVFTEKTVEPTECIKSNILQDQFSCTPIIVQGEGTGSSSPYISFMIPFVVSVLGLIL